MNISKLIGIFLVIIGLFSLVMAIFFAPGDVQLWVAGIVSLLVGISALVVLRKHKSLDELQAENEREAEEMYNGPKEDIHENGNGPNRMI